MAEVRFDLVLFGVTGYTGELALRYLAGLPASERGRVAIAGRDAAKVRAVCERVAPNGQLEIIVADAEEPASVDAMVSRTRVLIHLAGPYTDRGPAVVAACVAHGTHYVDLTGEPLFVRDMIANHHAAARHNGVRIIHSAGFESLPFDMTALFAVAALRRKSGVACDRLQLSLEMKIHDRAVLKDAALSGGTVATILLLLAQDASGPEMVDPALLLPDAVDRDGARARHPLVTKSRRDPLTGAWATPVYPAPTLNPQVILRSAALYEEAGGGYGPEFAYSESATLRGVVAPAAQRVTAAAMSMMIGRVSRVIEGGSPWQRKALAGLVRKFGAKSGEGPRHDLLERFDYGLLARATGPEGEQVTVAYEGRGNPGYLSTAQMVVQAGLALAFDEAALPQMHGVLTPAAGLGLAFTDRLEKAGVVMREVG